ncbi:DNA2/NAM7 helicase-like, C-terminal [Fusarium oxysporum f. sp. vasinfectum]|nr:DNA2/NAM7 helicase-like, C-terminal [Fusarium oxysporum f. sp. vasinfectum]
MAENQRNASRGFRTNNPTRPCFIFQQGKTCKFGRGCKFLHDAPTPPRTTAQLYSPDPPSAAPDGKLRQWKRLLKLGEPGWTSPDLTTTAVSRFFQLGLEMMDGDIGAVQDVIKLLAKDAGLAFVRALADVHIPRAANSCKTTLWKTEIKPLFTLVTHPRVVDSAVLEQQVADVFNCLLGIEGQRMAKIFNFIIAHVTESSASNQIDSRMEVLELSLSVLSKIIDCNTRNIVNSECDKLVTLFARILKSEPDDKDEFSRLQASKYIDYMEQRLDTGKDIPDLDPSRSVLLTRENFVLQHDLPGTLSADGPRHSNDHADITKIEIMPTYDEIVSPRGEYLPTNNHSGWHVKGIRGRLDREFRLVREDTVGQLRDAVRDILELARDPKQSKARKSNSLRTCMYENPVTIDVDLHRVGGLEMSISCHQLEVVRRLNAKKRKEWWMQSKRLQAGALVCLFDITGSMLFCVVSDTTMRYKNDKGARRIFDSNDEDQVTLDQGRTLSDDPNFLFVNLKLVDPTASEINQAMRWYQSIESCPRRHLVEFPGVLLESFKHSLSALQKMHERPIIPFANLLAPKEDSPSDADIELPQYARKAGFAFDLSCLTNGNTPLTLDPRSPIGPETLSLNSSLDLTQSAALLNTLTRELSLIQGPPGTGKSYTGEKLIKVLMKSRKRANLGPILCVCYTNHALDQLLEHLLDDGTKSIIRIGSRSKSERLQNLNLRSITKGMLLTKSEKRGLWEAERDIREHVQDGKDLLKELAACQSWKAIKTFLASDYPLQHAELFGEDHGGWQTVIHQQEMVIDRWLQSGQHKATNPRPLEHLECAQLNSLTNHYNDAIRCREEIRGDVDLRCLSNANVVGVTTTGLARNLNLLRKLRCKVMLCEEAGEVLEAHILTALLPSIEHAILIGDHLQLRPQIQNYDLQSTNPRGKQYSLDVSLFERLVQPPHDTDLRLPYSMLETQRRMHPSIAELVRSSLYPSLNDGEAVREYPQVVGMKRRLFWFHHDQPENMDGDNSSLSTSRSNSFEVDMTAALVSHLSQQGTYRPGDIAVLTPYLGQLQLLRRRMESMFEIYVNDRDLDELEAAQDEDEGSNRPRSVPLSKTTLLKSVRVATVDNFQGEEAKVIVISLVRSNPQGDCGFLKTSNRINVLLSRAKHGMYIIGNGNSYNKVPMWAHVMKMLASGQNLGTKLELQCARHPDTPIFVSHPDHFLQFSPESGCPSLCGEVCPTSKFCQVCATDEVKSVCVDFLEMKEYKEIDLDQEPCIFPDCGHFLTVSSMDGQMDMAEHYKLDTTGLPGQILRSSEPFAMENKDVKNCATCRGPLRNISRYGRIVRRAILDEATKKFISWSNSEYHLLAAKLVTEQENLAAMQPTAIRDPKSGAAGNLTIGGSRQRQLHCLRGYIDKRYDSILKMRKEITSYTAKVRKEEQPFQRVADLVRHANLHHDRQNEFRYDESVIQAKGSLLASTLLLKCDVLILSDFFRLFLDKKSDLAKQDVKLDLSPFMSDCDILIQRAKKGVYPREEAQGHIFSAQLCAFSRSLASTTSNLSIPGTERPSSTPTYDPDTLDKLRIQGLDHIQEARRILAENQSTNVLKNDIDIAEEALNGGVYRPVTTEELRQVYMASMGELSGTGHWYTCPNGHPFTINNCGMAMEEAPCPECGVRIGGRNHVSVEGVKHAVEIEEIAREIGGFRL